MADKLSRLLYTPVVSDVLDSFGLMHQALRPFVRPLDETLVLFGPARTGRYERATMPSPEHNPYKLEMDLIDSLRPGEVVVLACGGPTEVIAPWGELLSTAARAKQAAGCVTDGLVRDVGRIRAMLFPVFHGGIGPLDTKNRAEMVEKDADRHRGRGFRFARGLDPRRRRRRGRDTGGSIRTCVSRRARKDRRRGHDPRRTRSRPFVARGLRTPRRTLKNGRSSRPNGRTSETERHHLDRKRHIDGIFIEHRLTSRFAQAHRLEGKKFSLATGRIRALIIKSAIGAANRLRSR